jgi:hypothetical protein
MPELGHGAVLVVGEGHHAGRYVLQEDVADVVALVEVGKARRENKDAGPEGDSFQALFNGRAAAGPGPVTAAARPPGRATPALLAGAR